MNESFIGGSSAAGQAGSGLIEFLLWFAIAVGLITMLFAFSSLWKTWQMPSGQRDWGRGIKLFIASLVLGSPLVFGDMVQTAFFGEGADSLEAPEGFDLFDTPFDAPKPEKPSDSDD